MALGEGGYISLVLPYKLQGQACSPNLGPGGQSTTAGFWCSPESPHSFLRPPNPAEPAPVCHPSPFCPVLDYPPEIWDLHPCWVLQPPTLRSPPCYCGGQTPKNCLPFCLILNCSTSSLCIQARRLVLLVPRLPESCHLDPAFGYAQPLSLGPATKAGLVIHSTPLADSWLHPPERKPSLSVLTSFPPAWLPLPMP